MGLIRHQTSTDNQTYHDAAEHTAEQLADSWLTFVEMNQTNNGSCSSSGINEYVSVAHKTWQTKDQSTEMAQAGLDSSVLAPFLPEPDIDHPQALPPIGPVYVDPHSDMCFQKIILALELDSSHFTYMLCQTGLNSWLNSTVRSFICQVHH